MIVEPAHSYKLLLYRGGLRCHLRLYHKYKYSQFWNQTQRIYSTNKNPNSTVTGPPPPPPPPALFCNLERHLICLMNYIFDKECGEHNCCNHR